jgi:predicted dehydrogenase
MAKNDRSRQTHPQATGPIGVALIGTKFMGRAHSTAWGKCAQFFDLRRPPTLALAAGRNHDETAAFAAKWGWNRSTVAWRDVLSDPEVELVDVSTPNHLHAEMSIASLEAGKHVACEKPLAGTLADAKQMVLAARAAAKKGVRTFVWYNYRRCPAVALAHRLVREDRLGRIFHVRASYLQDWGGPDTPLLWRFQAAQAGSGAHGDLNAHIIDMARFITGDEVTEVVGAIEETFVKERAIVASVGGEISGKGAKSSASGKKSGKSTVDDAVLFLARFKHGAVASFEATRLATGNQNRNNIEINGEKGSIRFDFERMNELEWWDNTLDAKLRGWSRIMCTDAAHPYAGHYWPAAHLIGYEHGFISQAADICAVVAGGAPVVPLPDFEDAFKTQCVLEAAIRSARERRPVPIRELDKF